MILTSFYSRIFAIAILAILLNSCLKGNNYMNVGNTTPVVEFQLSAASDNTYPIAYTPASDSAGIDTAVNDTAIFVVIASPQAVNDTEKIIVKLDTSQISAYNAANGTSFSLIPNSLLAFYGNNLYTGTGLDTLVILPGQRYASIPININIPAILNQPYYNYALPLAIVSAGNLDISTTSGIFMWTFSAPVISFALGAPASNPVAQVFTIDTLPLQSQDTTRDTTIALVVTHTDGISSFAVPVSIDSALVNTYNTLHGTSYVILPDSLFTLGTSVAFGAGVDTEYVNVQFVFSQFNPTVNYIFPITISPGATNIGATGYIGFDYTNNQSTFVWVFQN